MKLTTLLTLFLVLSMTSSAWAKDVIDHKPFDEVLSTYVDSKGRVDYAGLKANEKDYATFKAYLAEVGTAKVDGSADAKLAFYINAYNATVINAVIDNLPTTSVMKVDGFFKKAEHQVAGKSMTLDALEHSIIRPTFKDARVHFALVCAAKSCPPLQRDAFTEKNVQKMLERNAKKFIPRATKIDKEAKTVTTSKLFEWFADDFKANEGSVAKYLAKYMPDDAEFLSAGEFKLGFSKYDWKLNAK